jgi:hypothetical protein
MVHEYFPQRYQNAMEVLEELPEMTIKINSSRQGQKSRGKTSIGKTSIGKTSIGKPNSHGQGQTSTVKVKQPKPKLGKIRRLRSILVALVGNGFLVVLTKYFWDMSTSQQYVSQENSQENSSVFSQETPLEDISTPPPTPSLSASSKTTTIPNSEGSLPRAKNKGGAYRQTLTTTIYRVYKQTPVATTILYRNRRTTFSIANFGNNFWSSMVHNN